MPCTYGGLASHTMGGCPTRPRLASLTIVLALGACSNAPPVPPSKLLPPPAQLMAEPEALDPIPACEGEETCRARYYAASRAQYGTLADRTRGLQRWARASHGK